MELVTHALHLGANFIKFSVVRDVWGQGGYVILSKVPSARTAAAIET